MLDLFLSGSKPEAHISTKKRNLGTLVTFLVNPACPAIYGPHLSSRFGSVQIPNRWTFTTGVRWTTPSGESRVTRGPGGNRFFTFAVVIIVIVRNELFLSFSARHCREVELACVWRVVCAERTGRRAARCGVHFSPGSRARERSGRGVGGPGGKSVVGVG